MISQILPFTFSIILTVIFGSTLIIPPVKAAKPHFGTPTISKKAVLSLTANFKVVSLGKKAADAYLSTLSTERLGCVNPGGNSPPSKKVDFEQMLNQTMNMKPKDGKIKRTLTLGPPVFSSVSEICPNKNWNVDILTLIYENVTLDIQRKHSDIFTFDYGNVIS